MLSKFLCLAALWNWAQEPNQISKAIPGSITHYTYCSTMICIQMRLNLPQRIIIMTQIHGQPWGNWKRHWMGATQNVCENASMNTGVNIDNTELWRWPKLSTIIQQHLSETHMALIQTSPYHLVTITWREKYRRQKLTFTYVVARDIGVLQTDL